MDLSHLLKPDSKEEVIENTRKVIKRDGSVVAFDPNKLNQWAEYAARHGASWSEVAIETNKRLPGKCKSSEIMATMIKVCLDKEDIAYSRVAARLEYAKLRKNMQNLGYGDKLPFHHIFSKMIELELWDIEVMPEYNPAWESWYEDLTEHYMEYWQIAQWVDKYSVKHNEVAVETPHIGALGIALAIHGDTEDAFLLAKNIVRGFINLPTPVLNGCRNGDFDSISCCVLTGGDSIDSIGVAEHMAYKMTAKKAGIGIEMNTRSKGDPVKGGRIDHLGKQPIYAAIDKSVKMFTQVSRGGSATVSFSVYDPEIMDLLLLKSQRTPENVRIDKLDYSMVYDNAFLRAVISDDTIQTVSVIGVKGKEYKAREILFAFLTTRQETGRLYCFNKEEANDHTPFIDEINLSNLCQEICLPTKAYESMSDLYSESSEGETAFCSLAAINPTDIQTEEEYEGAALSAVRTVDILISKVDMFAGSLKNNLNKRRSLGIGITGLASWLHKEGLLYANDERIAWLAERHYFYCLKASQKLVEEGLDPVEGIKKDWLPIDTMKGEYELHYDWELLRGKSRRNSVLVAHMPTESSAVFSNATNGLYPVRNRIVSKQSRYGMIQYIAPDVKELAWDIDNTVLARAYSAVQCFTDQAISADYYVTPSNHKNGKVAMSTLMREWVVQARLGLKTMYYQNTNDYNGGVFKEEPEECGACKL